MPIPLSISRSGAFAKRDLPKGTTVTGTPLLVFPDIKWFDMYDFQTCPDGSEARNMTNGPYRQQLLLNYCFSHPESTVILCPYGSGVNYINHNKTRANVKVQWAQDGITSHQDKSLNTRPKKDIADYSTTVAFDYVATRNIAEDEEIFLDYGDVWEDQWKQHGEDYDNTYLKDYVSATEFNSRHGKDPLLTTEEQLLNPYPDNLFIRCHSLIESSKRIFDGNVSELATWHTWEGDNSGYSCEILKSDHKNEFYSVKVETHDTVSKKVSGVPREAIKFADHPYSKLYSHVRTMSCGSICISCSSSYEISTH